MAANCLDGLVVKAFAMSAESLGFEFQSVHGSDSNIRCQTLWVSARIGWPCVSVL